MRLRSCAREVVEPALRPGAAYPARNAWIRSRCVSTAR